MTDKVCNENHTCNQAEEKTHIELKTNNSAQQSECLPRQCNLSFFVEFNVRNNNQRPKK